MLIFKALHILSMFAVVTAEIGAEFLYVFAISRRDVRGLATIHRILEQARLGPISIALFVAGVAFGLLTAATSGFDFFAGWLIAAYALVAAILVSGSRLWPKTLLPLGARSGRGGGGTAPGRGRGTRHGRQSCSRVVRCQLDALCVDHPGHGPQAVLTRRQDATESCPVNRRRLPPDGVRVVQREPGGFER